MLWTMSTFAERLTHALKARNMQPVELDRALARRFQKKGSGAGYTHRLLHRDQSPRRESLEAIAEILGVADPWLLRGEGPMDRTLAQAIPTYDSLPGWVEASSGEASRGRVPEYAIRAAGRSPAFVRPAQVTADFVFQAASFWLQHAPEDDRLAAMRAEALRVKGTETGARRR